MYLLGAFGTWGGWPALTAIGTVGAVVLALGLHWWIAHKEHEARPKLTLYFDAHRKVEETNPQGALIPYLRLAVTNAAGKESAEEVELLILEIKEYTVGAGGSGGRTVWLANPALGWANSNNTLPRMTIPPGATRYADVGCWMQLTPLSLVLAVVPQPGSMRHILTPGGWRIRVAATMRNGDATFWDVSVAYGEKVTSGLAALVDLHASVKQIASANAE